MGVTLGLRLISNSISLSGGNPGRSSGKTAGYSFTTGMEDRLGFSSDVIVMSARLHMWPFWINISALLGDMIL